MLEIVTRPSCLVSTLVDMDDTTKKGSKNIVPSSESEEPAIAYRPIYDETKAKVILEHNINEHNKDNPKVKIYLYPDTVKMISRLIRILQSPHECGHAMVLANGFPGLPLPMVKIAAYICGFTVFQIQPSTLVLGEKYAIEHFKLDIVNAYTTAGLKGEKLLFALNETELYDEDFLVYITEFLVSNSISHLFNEEEHTSITNAIRTDVTQAGLSYTKETAWNFFLKTVRENLRFVFILSSVEDKFPKRCRQFPGMINAMQILPLPHWTKDELVSCVLYHLIEVKIFNETEKENIAHLLASMHLAISESGGTGKKSGKFRHVTNTTFERFVEFFVDLAERRHAEIEKEYDMIFKTLEAIKRGSELANQLKSQLEHEKIVLEQKKQGNFTLLSQIGQDKAITEEQVRLVRKQQWKIDKLEKLLPRYQDSHERAVFKAAAMVKETKHILAVLDQQGLSDLRSMQKPDSDVEDVLASVIIIIKSPTSDLTWNKGAKRIMANLERFRDDLAAFDEVEMTEETLQVVEPYIKRPHFGSGFMEKKTSNIALESLVSWVRGVVKYHRMMLSRVKPLHKMVEQTRSALDEAVEKLGGMESKLRNLDNRMLSLSEKFEDASVDKSKQGLLTEEQQRQLAQAADFERLLASGTEQWMLVLESISNRRKSMVGSAAVSAGFATYLGPCNYQFRQTMIEKVWMECLRERGIAADTKIADNLTVNITMSMSTLSIANSVDAEDVAVNLETEDVEEQRKESEEEKSQNNEKNEGEARDEESKALTEQSSARIEDVQENEDKVSPQSSSKSLVDKQMEEVQSLISTGGHSYYHYDQHLLAHLMLLSGNGSQRNWISKGLNYRQLEEASIFVAAVQTPLFIIDPYNRAMQMLDIIASDMVKIDMTQRNSTILNTIEKSVTAGDTLVIYNVENEIDSFLFPIIDHINTKSRLHMDEETSVVKINGRRLLIHPSFQLILIHSSPYPIIHEELASTMTVIDLRPNANGIVRHFLLSAVERVRPALCTEDNKIYYELFQCYDTLGKLDNDAMALIRRKQGAGIWEETELITDIVMKRSQMAARFSQVILNLQRMHFHRAKFVPLAKCVSSAFNILSSLSSLRSEYQFPFDFIVSLFELATGGKENEQSSKLIYVSVDCDKPKSRTPANKRKDEKSMKNASELLGVNLDKITHMLAADGKEFNDFKGAEIIKPVSELLVVDGPNELPEELQIDVPPTEDDVATDVPEMCKEFFRIFYKHVSKSLSSEHHSLFTLLCWLRMKITDFAAPDPDSIGMLLEKNCSKEQVVSESKCPSWLPLESLNLLVSFSASFPSVTSVTESIATESNSWYSWYIDPAPETLPLPMTLKEEDAPVKDSVTTTDDQHEDKEESKDDQAIETESVLHGSEAFDQQSKDTTKLLVIKCLRPDRFHNAITTLCASDFNEFQRQIDYNFDELMSCTCDPKPVLILLPSSKDETDGIDDRKTFTASYGADVLAQKAKEKGLNLIQAHVFDGNEKMINLSLNNAVSTENWILIEDLHLGEANWLREFTKRVARLHEQSDPKMQWRIIMTTEPCDKLPLQLLYLCEKISLDALVAVNEKLSFFNLSEESSIIKKNIVIALKCPNEQLWTGSREKSLVHRDLLYTLCVAHGIMLSRQVFTPRTFTLKPRITCEDLLRSTEYASKYFESTVEKINLSLKDICQVICEDIYCGKAINDTDKNYIRMIFSCISNGLSSNLGSAIQFGTCSIAIPPANVDPLDYPNWFIDKAGPSEGESLTLEFMHLDEVNGRNINEQRSTAFIEELRQLYEATLDEPFSTTCGTNKSAEWIKLRQSIDLCKEKLPSLLKIDDCFGMTFSDIRQNPQLRSLSPFSEKSLLLSQKEELSTSISYCLLKECQWLNQLLFKISSSIDDLAKALISGMHAIPNCYKNILEPLNNSRVPDEWIHGHSDCKLKTLTDWLNDLSRAHSQLNAWLKRGVVPKPTSEPTIGRGNLELVDLRLLRNPGGLIDSLKYTTAISNGVKLSEVPLKCYFSKRQSKLPSVPPGLKSSDGVILSGLFIEGASWDMENGLLLEQQNAAEKLPYVFVTTDIRSTRDETAVFHCPVFMNRFRQDMLFTLPLPLTSNEDVDKFYLKGVYIMLDPLPVKV